MVTRSERRQLSEYLGPLELRIMESIWAMGDGTVNDVLDRLNRRAGRKLVYNTVMTTMARLGDKGFLTRERDGRAYRYFGGSAEQFLRDRAVEGFREAYSNLGELAASAFVEAVSDLPPADRADLLGRLRLLDEA